MAHTDGFDINYGWDNGGLYFETVIMMGYVGYVTDRIYFATTRIISLMYQAELSRFGYLYESVHGRRNILYGFLGLKTEAIKLQEYRKQEEKP